MIVGSWSIVVLSCKLGQYISSIILARARPAFSIVV